MLTQAVPVPLPKASPRRSRLLYVLDDIPGIALVELLAAGRGDLVLLRALDFEQGLTLARDEQPDAILLDINLLGTRSVEFMKRLHADAGTEAIPILALGANPSPAAFAKAIDVGFFRYLAKPLQAAPFLEALAYALEFTAMERSERGTRQPMKESR
jgi:CheY-like chemotaxis protein